MNEKAKAHLKQLITIDFNKYLSQRMAGYCRRNYDIAVYNGLGFDFIEDLKAKYLNVFNTEL